MSNKKSLFVPAALLFVSFLAVSAASAENPQCYTLASIQGSYSVIGTYGANLALALGLRVYDGNGNLTATFLVNEPKVGSTTGERTIVTGTQTGTYTVNCDGTGTFTRFVTLADGTKSTVMDDFLITAAIVQDGQLIATVIQDAQRIPSTIVAGGIFLIHSITRLPD
jgi:hypothetical protein